MFRPSPAAARPYERRKALRAGPKTQKKKGGAWSRKDAWKDLHSDPVKYRAGAVIPR